MNIRPRASQQSSPRRRAWKEVGPILERDRPDAVERVLGGLRDAQRRPTASQRSRSRARSCGRRQRVVPGVCLPMIGNCASTEPLDRLLRTRVPLQHEPEHGHEHEQQREDREEGVVGDQRSEAAAWSSPNFLITATGIASPGDAAGSDRSGAAERASPSLQPADLDHLTREIDHALVGLPRALAEHLERRVIVDRRDAPSGCPWRARSIARRSSALSSRSTSSLSASRSAWRCTAISIAACTASAVAGARRRRCPAPRRARRSRRPRLRAPRAPGPRTRGDLLDQLECVLVVVVERDDRDIRVALLDDLRDVVCLDGKRRHVVSERRSVDASSSSRAGSSSAARMQSGRTAGNRHCGEKYPAILALTLQRWFGRCRSVVLRPVASRSTTRAPRTG